MGLMLNNKPIKGEVHLGKQTIGKMYYNHELVYENALPSGTVVFDDYLSLSENKTIQITLKNVEVGMTNISKGLNVYFDINGIGSDTQFASVDDLKNGIICNIGGLSFLKLAWKTGTNQLYVKLLSGYHSVSLKIKVA